MIARHLHSLASIRNYKPCQHRETPSYHYRNLFFHISLEVACRAILFLHVHQGLTFLLLKVLLWACTYLSHLCTWSSALTIIPTLLWFPEYYANVPPRKVPAHDLLELLPLVFHTHKLNIILSDRLCQWTVVAYSLQSVLII